MRKAVYAAVILLLLGGAWFAIWHRMMAGPVAQVEATIAHHHTAIKAITPSATFKADGVHASGFPFAFRVTVERPTLTQIWGDETFAVSVPSLELPRVDTGEGRYRVRMPATFEALYARPGLPPEQFEITPDAMPAILLRAAGDSRACSNLPGARACTVQPTDPLISFAVQLPASLILKVERNGEAKQIGFRFVPLNLPVFAAIPGDVTRPLQIFVGMLREAYRN